jgi:cation diffusion facilitator CzcD-associated flavoprotein CzcO
MTSADRLAALEGRARDEMARIEAGAPLWFGAPGSDPDGIHPVVVCGAGVSGLAIAFAVRRLGVPALVIDQAEVGEEGPWRVARMPTLRSPKTLSGPDLGVPSLTARSWYEARHGAEAWERLGRIGRTDWIDYLAWVRKASGVEVENQTRLVAVAPHPRGLSLTLETGGGTRRDVLCRRLVLATGIEGYGGPHVPDAVRTLPGRAWAHSSEAIEMASLDDKDVAVLGAAASSFDWAVSALAAGARSVTLLARSADLPRTEVLTWTNFPGLLTGFAEMADLDRWRFARLYFGFRMPPTQDQYDRARSHPSFIMRLGRPLRAASMEGDKVRLATDDGVAAYDRLLLGTGYAIDLASRRELSNLASEIALWSDLFRPPRGEEDETLAAYPYLGPGFEFIPKRVGADWVSRVHFFNPGALPSLGPVSNGVTGLKYGARRIAAALVRALFLEETSRYLEALAAYAEPHFDPRLVDAAATDGDVDHVARSAC